MSIGPLKILNAYVELMDSNHIEDAVILHLMYSLGINPETISLLKFSLIDKDRNIRYFDTNLKRNIKVKLNNRLWNDIEFLKQTNDSNERKGEQSNKGCSSKLKGKKIFITTLTIAGLFKRFSRGFNEKVGWFAWKPQCIVNLSKKMRLTYRYQGSRESLDLVNDNLMFTN